MGPGNPGTLGILLILGCATLAAQQAPIPVLNEIGGRPYSIRDKWIIGGSGTWDYLTLDPQERRLYVTHQRSVQVVDLDTGAVAGTIGAFGDARKVVLDSSGQYGYVSDSLDNNIALFNRRSLTIERRVQLSCSPRSIALVPDQSLLLAVCIPSDKDQIQVPSRRNRHTGTVASSSPAPPRVPEGFSQLALIDTDTMTPLAYLIAPGEFRTAQGDTDGAVYVTVGPVKQLRNPHHPWGPEDRPPLIARIDAASIAAGIRQSAPKKAAKPEMPPPAPTLDTEENEFAGVRYFRLDNRCSSPRGLAVDSRDHRLFVACEDQDLLVLDSARGSQLASLTIGPGTDAIAWDENHSLVFTANGGGYGSMSVIVRHETDTYAVIQNLPTMERARTVAVDPSTGQVYLVTDLHGARLDHPPANGIGTLKLDPIAGSFQVLVVGN